MVGGSLLNEFGWGGLTAALVIGTSLMVIGFVDYIVLLRKRLNDATRPEGDVHQVEVHPSSIAVLDARMRAFLAGLLVVGTFVVVIWAITTGAKPQDISLLLTPLVGLSGIAIGYFFTQGSHEASDAGGNPQAHRHGPANDRQSPTTEPSEANQRGDGPERGG